MDRDKGSDVARTINELGGVYWDGHQAVLAETVARRAATAYRLNGTVNLERYRGGRTITIDLNDVRTVYHMI